jgi:hypothetical protein
MQDSGVPSCENQRNKRSGMVKTRGFVTTKKIELFLLETVRGLSTQLK